MNEWQLFGFSLFGGLTWLFSWQCWLAGILNVIGNCLLIALTLGPTFLSVKKEEDQPGCFSTIIAGTVQGLVRTLFMGATVAYLFPLMMGHSEALPWAEVVKMLPDMFKASLVAGVTVFIWCLIPIVGTLINNSPGMQAFMQGSIIFKMCTEPIIKKMLPEMATKAGIAPPPIDSFYPGMGTWICYCIIAGVLTLVIFFLCYGLEWVFWHKIVRKEEFVEAADKTMPGLMIIGPSVGVLAGLCTLFMYSTFTVLAMLQVIHGAK